MAQVSHSLSGSRNQLFGVAPKQHITLRHGGEEFVIVLPNVLPQAALVVCERLRKNIEHFNWQAIHPDLVVTVSIGIACDTTVPTHEKLLSLADEKMYQAKRSGKNRVCS